jgi:hypothetical protein
MVAAVKIRSERHLLAWHDAARITDPSLRQRWALCHERAAHHRVVSTDMSADGSRRPTGPTGPVSTQSAPASGAVAVDGPSGARAVGVAGSRLGVMAVLTTVVEGYLFGDLESMKTEIAPKKFGAVGYPMVSAALAGCELLGALASGKTQGPAIRFYFKTFLSKVDARYSSVDEIAASLVRNGIAHNYLSKHGVGVTRGARDRHLTLEDGHIIVDCIALYEDLRTSYDAHAKAYIAQHIQEAQGWLDQLRALDQTNADRMLRALPVDRFPVAKPSTG